MKTGYEENTDHRTGIFLLFIINFIDTEMFTDAGKSKNLLITGIQTLTLKQLDVL